MERASKTKYPRWEAPKGYIWICKMCGKFAYNKADIGDESCFIWAELAEDDEDLKKGEEVIGGNIKWKNC